MTSITSKAIRIDQQGGPEQLKLVEVSVGDPRPGEIRIRHRAIGLNFIDVYQRSGLYPMPVPLQLGMEAAGVVEAVALLALAAVVAVPATRGRGRIVAGLLVLAGGVAGVVGAIDSRAGARTQVQHALPAGSSVVTEPWWVVAALGGLLLAAVGAVLIVRGPRWSALSSRYEPPSGQANLKGDAGTWDALDRGEDPTA